MYVNTFKRMYDKICINAQKKRGENVQFPRLKDLREDEQLKQEEIAKILTITQQQYSLYETGKREIPLSMCIVLSKLYKVSLDYIAGLTNDKRGIGYNIENQDNSHSKYNIKQSNNGGKNIIKIKDNKNGE